MIFGLTKSYQAHYTAWLQSELGLEPSRAMVEALRNLRAEPVAPPTPTDLNAPPLVGRESVWNELERETAGLTLIAGEAGVGKTRVATDFARAHGFCLLVPHRDLAAQVGFGGVIEGLRTRYEAGWRPLDLEPRSGGQRPRGCCPNSRMASSMARPMPGGRRPKARAKPAFVRASPGCC